MNHLVKVLLALIALASITESRVHKRETPSDICNTVYTNTSKIQCFCVRDRSDNVVKSADCSLTSPGVPEIGSHWDSLETIKTVTKIKFLEARGIELKYIPTNGIKYLKDAERIDVKYGHIHEIQPYAFANLSQIDQVALSDNNIALLRKYAFANHKKLTEIILDNNKIVEINRDVFFNLPSLKKLFMTANSLTTIHDKALRHLTRLQELDLIKNSIFSLNIETFFGLGNLQKLQLSFNSLEVIGDNTFLPLVNLLYLDLEDNNIQMLDEKAFSGLSKLQILMLSGNKLKAIDNVRVFEGLPFLRSLSLKGNKLVELKAQLLAPIINNARFFFNFEDNEFPCNCRLEYFVDFRNRTDNEDMKLALDNLKCLPDESLSEAWKKLVEAESKSIPEEDVTQNAPETDYEYYDESQLNGKLFYVDIRHLLNCTAHTSSQTVATPTNAIAEVKTTPEKIEPPPKETKINSAVKPKPETKVFNRGVLELSLEDTTVNDIDKTADGKDAQSLKEVKPKHTTSRVATVSPKPFKNTHYEDKEMASDEAAPGKFQTHQRNQEYIIKEDSKYKNSAFRSNANSINILIFIPLTLYLRVN